MNTMQSKVTLKVSNYTNLNIGVSSEEGDKINKLIESSFKGSKIVELDFSDLKLLTTAFLNAVIGQLYSKYTSDYLNDHLKLINVQQEDVSRFTMVIDRAKDYFKDKKKFAKGVKKILEDGE